MSRAKCGPTYIDLIGLAERLEISLQRATKLVRSGVIGSRKLPGLRAEYLLADVERLERESITPAKAS